MSTQDEMMLSLQGTQKWWIESYFFYSASECKQDKKKGLRPPCSKTI